MYANRMPTYARGLSISRYAGSNPPTDAEKPAVKNGLDVDRYRWKKQVHLGWGYD